MDRQAREATVSALKEWAAGHPKPDDPLLMLGKSLLSPNQMATAVDNETEDGRLLIAVIEQSAGKYGLDSILESLRRSDASKPEPQPGDRMPDGTVYAGISPDTNKPMYATPADAPLTYTFNQAQKYSAQLDAHGHHDWRAPTKGELNVLYNNRAAIGGFDISGSYPAGWYWSSRDSLDTAWAQRFSDGNQNDYLFSKNYDSSLRCVRG